MSAVVFSACWLHFDFMAAGSEQCRFLKFGDKNSYVIFIINGNV